MRERSLLSWWEKVLSNPSFYKELAEASIFMDCGSSKEETQYICCNSWISAWDQRWRSRVWARVTVTARGSKRDTFWWRMMICAEPHFLKDWVHGCYFAWGELLHEKRSWHSWILPSRSRSGGRRRFELAVVVVLPVETFQWTRPQICEDWERVMCGEISIVLSPVIGPACVKKPARVRKAKWR